MRILTVSALVLLPSGALAANCGGSSEFLSVENWKVEKVEGLISGIDITVDVKSHAPKPFRMIDADYTFEDALGRRISAFKIDPDLKAKPGETVSSTNGYMGTEMDRVPNMNRDDVIVAACTHSVIYDDGTKEEFK